MPGLVYSIAISSILSAFRPSATVRNPGETHTGKWRPDFTLIWVSLKARSPPASFPGAKGKQRLLTVRAPSCHCNGFARLCSQTHPDDGWGQADVPAPPPGCDL